MSIGNQLMNNIQSKAGNPRDLIIMILVIVFLVDFFMKGKLGYLWYAMKYVNMIIKAGDWKFVVIVMLLLLRR